MAAPRSKNAWNAFLDQVFKVLADCLVRASDLIHGVKFLTSEPPIVQECPGRYRRVFEYRGRSTKAVLVICPAHPTIDEKKELWYAGGFEYIDSMPLGYIHFHCRDRVVFRYS